MYRQPPVNPQDGVMSNDQATPTIEPWLRDILRCPACGGHLLDHQDAPSSQVNGLICADCRLLYRIDDGIPVLLVDEAHPAAEQSAE
jgi:uncharacterized protein YbaR (Trm112 family)